MRRMLLLAAVAGTLLAPVALAQAPAAKPDLARAESIVKEVCAACHGVDGNSPSPTNPSLAGQGAEYIALQLQHFQSGIRVNPIMQGMAAALKPDEMKALGVYFSQQKPKGLSAKDATLAMAGQKLYRGGDGARGIPACMACHGPAGRGNPAAGYPALQAQYAVYTVKQLENYANDARYAKDANGKTLSSPNALMMNLIASRLSAEDRRNLASYIQGIR